MRQLTAIVIAVASLAGLAWRGAFDDAYFAAPPASAPYVSPGHYAGAWSNGPALPVARSIGSAAIHDGKIWYGSGQVAQTNVYYCDGTEWVEVRGLPLAKRSAGFISYTNALHSVGMREGTESHVFDGTDWYDWTDVPVGGSEGYAPALMDGTLWAFNGGYTDTWYYASGTWVNGPAKPVPIDFHASCFFRDKIYLVGGSGSLTNFYKFDGTATTEIIGLPDGHGAQFCSMATNNLNRLVVANGYSGGDSTYVYEFDGTNWTAGVSLPTASSGHSLVNYKGDLWLMGVGTLGVGSTNVLVLKLLPGDE